MTNYTTKSMNGIITIDDGMGTVISGGTISTDDLQLTNLICDNIQGSSPSDDVYLYTNTTTGTINIGAGAAASATTIRTDNLEALTGNTINIGRSTDSLTYPGVYNKFPILVVEVVEPRFNVPLVVKLVAIFNVPVVKLFKKFIVPVAKLDVTALPIKLNIPARIVDTAVPSDTIPLTI